MESGSPVYAPCSVLGKFIPGWHYEAARASMEHGFVLSSPNPV